MQFLRREIKVTFNPQSSYFHAFHLIKRHIAQFPAVAHRNSTEADAGLGVILQEVSRVSSHREEIACVGDFIAYQSFLCAVQFGQLLSDAVGHEIIGVIRLLVRFWLLVGQINRYTQLLQLFLHFFLSFLFRHRYASFIELSVKTLLNFQGELCPDTLRQIFNATIKVILPCRFAVWVPAHRALCGDGSVGYVFPFTVKERIVLEYDRRAFGYGSRYGRNKLLFHALADSLARLLLQDDEVAAHFRPCILREHARRQAESGDKPAVLHQVTADGFVLGTVQYALRGDECQQSALLDAVQSLHKKVIVDGSCGFTLENVFSLAVLPVIDHEITKGNVTCYKVVFILFLQLSDGFKGGLADYDVALSIRMNGL